MQGRIRGLYSSCHYQKYWTADPLIPVSGFRSDNPSPSYIESNWAQQWTKSDSESLQHDDTTCRTVINLLNSNTEKPSISSQNKELVALLQQWDLLRVVDNLLYRSWENDERPNTLQLVVPRTIRQEIITQLHDSRTAGHLGRDKTVNRIRSRHEWWCRAVVQDLHILSKTKVRTG